MKPFLILRVPVIWDADKKPLRRPTFGANPTVVGDAQTADELAELVGGLSLGDLRHHYYGLEIKFTGASDWKTAIAFPAPGAVRPREVANNRNRKEQK